MKSNNQSEKRTSFWSVATKYEVAYFGTFSILAIAVFVVIVLDANAVEESLAKKIIAIAGASAPAFITLATLCIIVPQGVQMIAEQFFKRRYDEGKKEGIVEGIAKGEAKKEVEVREKLRPVLDKLEPHLREEVERAINGEASS